MRRGLIKWSKAELPEAALAARVLRLRRGMAASGLDAFLAYTNNTTPAAVSWLTGFVPYWSEALLVVPRAGELTLVVALTPRVKPWIEATARVARVEATPRIGSEAGRILAAAGATAVGIEDLERLPAGHATDLREAAPAVMVRDGAELFAAARAPADPAEVALAAKAGAIAQAALSEVRASCADAGEAVAAVEAEARRLGAEEAYIAIAPDLAAARQFRRAEGMMPLGPRFAVRASIAYKGVWVRLARMIGVDAGSSAPLAERFAAAVAGLPDPAGFAAFPRWLVEGAEGGQPLAPLVGSRVAEARPPRAGALVSIEAWAEAEGTPVVFAAPALLGRDGEPAALLVT